MNNKKTVAKSSRNNEQKQPQKGQGDEPEAVDEIRQLIEKRTIRAISVDTSIFDANGKRLDEGIFSQLRQFKDHPAKLIFPDVVVREMRQHLIEKMDAIRIKFAPAMRGFGQFLGADADEVIILEGKLKEIPESSVLADDQLDDFFEQAGAEILLAGNGAKMIELLDLYFGRKPPFYSGNSKKAEFPDAIALLTLESWAREKEQDILVVSKDGDWKSFCDQSDRLHVLRSLTTALELFQTPDDLVKSMIQLVYRDLKDNLLICI